MSVPRLVRAGDAGFCTVVVARERGGREGGGGGVIVRKSIARRKRLTYGPVHRTHHR